jgi:hypothetical protein
MIKPAQATGRGVRPWVGRAAAVGIGLCLCLGLGLVEREVGAASPAPRWITADAVIYLEAPAPARLIDRLVQPQAQTALRVVPQIEAFYRGQAYRTLRNVVGAVADRLEMPPLEALQKLTGGGMSLAVEAPPGGPPRPFLIVTPEEAGFADRVVDAALALARQQADQQGKPDPVKSSAYRGITGYALEKSVFALIEGSLVLSDKPEALKALIDRVCDGGRSGGTGPGPGALADASEFQARRGRVAPDTLAWGFARLDRLREVDPKRFGVPEKRAPQATFFFGSWFEALRTAPAIEAALSLSNQRLEATVSLLTPPQGYREAFQGFIPSQGNGAPGLVAPPGTILSASLWRNLSEIWEARTELFTPEAQQGLAKLDSFAGQFFGGRDFGSGVLGALDPRWRVVIAHQDYEAMSPQPDVKLPGFALIVDLNPDDDDFNQRLRVAYQSFVGLSNLNPAQQAGPPLELGSEVFEGINISTAHYMVPKADARADAKAGEKRAVDQRFNFTPSVAQVDNHFILSSSVGLTRSLIQALRTPGAANSSAATFQAEADGPTLAHLVALNRNRLVMQDMLQKGLDQAAAEAGVDRFEQLLRTLGHGRLTVQDRAGSLRFDLGFSLSNPR